ncbi:unnamed protein product [Tilletia controversa]|uniref:chitin deacetylase n=2 Tax=Tilletia TaxID=13289 RepID=A0A8X7MUN8_9BASI|nr:hypothetical protein CF336_g2959 [Tilletia laevis]KAE8201176.1 hypothetical protein CF328_g2752 [Tilletia controversa]CAD6889348.1 unnamed protein product [Tilletia caries]KAE8206071.1 hypothetical protein CF335_g2085 [Tilletia laevis]KAE8248981.1 hypothetical protein A4X06_0g3434 [Tilletia controversa]
MVSLSIFLLLALAGAESTLAHIRGPSSHVLRGLQESGHRRGLVQFQKTRAADAYPEVWVQTPPSKNKPEWTAALKAAVASGVVPDIPVGTLAADGSIKYPAGSKDPCNWTNSKCLGKNDISQAPDGMFVINFDDGPTEASPELYNFLGKNNQAGTHFMIGSNILGYPEYFKQAIQMGNQHIGVHTWSHNLSTTRTNEEMVGELGWTMQVIYDLSGKIPRYWRPPQGDIDNRVRAIAEEIFGLIAVMWNAECNDWCMNDDGSSGCPGEVPGEDQKSINHAINLAVAMPHSPGVILLEHELTKYSVGAFEQHTWPGVQQYGWKPVSVPEIDGSAWYANAFNGTSPTTSQSSMLKSNIVALPDVGAGASVSGSGSGSASNGTSGSSSSASTDSGKASSVSNQSNSNSSSGAVSYIRSGSSLAFSLMTAGMLGAAAVAAFVL